MTERLVVRLLVAFAALALLLAAVGLYGVLGHHVERRMAEIGVRLALGATRGAVLRSVPRESWVAAAAGSVVGLPPAVLLSRVLQTLLYQISPWNVRVLAGAVVCLMLVATSRRLTMARCSGCDSARDSPSAAPPARSTRSWRTDNRFRQR